MSDSPLFYFDSCSQKDRRAGDICRLARQSTPAPRTEKDQGFIRPSLALQKSSDSRPRQRRSRGKTELLLRIRSARRRRPSPQRTAPFPDQLRGAHVHSGGGGGGGGGGLRRHSGVVLPAAPGAVRRRTARASFVTPRWTRLLIDPAGSAGAAQAGGPRLGVELAGARVSRVPPSSLALESAFLLPKQARLVANRGFDHCTVAAMCRPNGFAANAEQTD